MFERNSEISLKTLMQCKEALRNEIERQTQEYLALGGEIKSIDYGIRREVDFGVDKLGISRGN